MLPVAVGLVSGCRNCDSGDSSTFRVGDADGDEIAARPIVAYDLMSGGR